MDESGQLAEQQTAGNDDGAQTAGAAAHDATDAGPEQAQQEADGAAGQAAGAEATEVAVAATSTADAAATAAADATADAPADSEALPAGGLEVTAEAETGQRASEEAAAAAADNAATPPAAATAATGTEDEQQQIPDAASIYATPSLTVGVKRSLEGDGSTADADAAGTTDAAAAAQAAPATDTQATGDPVSPAAAAASGAPAPSPKRQRRTSAPGSWDTVLRLLVPQRRVGLIIGKSGATISDLQKTTGARIQVVPAVPQCDERVVVLSAPEIPSAPTNGAVSALLGIHRVLSSADPEPPGTPTVVKLLVGRTQAAAVPAPQSQQGPAEASGAVNAAAGSAIVRLLRSKDLPMSALSNDRVVEVSGSPEAVGAALAALAARLRTQPPKQRPGGPALALTERMAAANRGFGSGPPPPPPRVAAQRPPPQQHYGRPQQYGAPASYY